MLHRTAPPTDEEIEREFAPLIELLRVALQGALDRSVDRLHRDRPIDPPRAT